MLYIENLSVNFQSERESSEAIKNISLSVDRGEILALVGESGSGKSVTALSVLQLLPAPPAFYKNGSILFSEDGQNKVDLLKLNQKELQRIRGNKVAMIFQEPMTSLNPVISCGKQVMEAILQHKRLATSEAKKSTIEWFDKVQLPQPDKIFDRYPHQLSGGQKQRVMIAMAMSCGPLLLICDEPTTALDVTVQKNILQLIKTLQQEQNIGVLFITHDLGLVAEFADRAAIMYKGSVVEQNTVQEIFHHPQQPYTKALLACRPGLYPKSKRLPVVSDFLDKEEEAKNNVFSPPDMINNLQKEPLINIKNITVSFPVRTNILGKVTNRYKAVDDVSFEVLKGETLGLVGESGCGKTTLGRTLLGLVEPSAGSIIYNGTDLTKLERKALQQFRKEVQLVFQDPFSSLNPRLAIGEAIEEPLKKLRLYNNGIERRKRVHDLLDKVNLPLNAATRYPHEFSGGQRQRIVIARALSMNPHFLVCDESVSALDVSVQAQVLNLLNDLKKDLGLTMLFISHDFSVVRYMCDRIMVMNKGQIIETDEAENLYHHPKSEYTKNLLKAIPKII